MTEEELLLRLNQAELFHDEVEAMRDFTRAEIASGRADPASFSRDFRTRFRAPYE